MLHQVLFEDYCRGIKVSAYSDFYAYDPEDDSLLFISLAGTEQAVRAISSAIIGYHTVSIRREGNTVIRVHGSPAAHTRTWSTKLPSGALHQIVADTRFSDANHTRGRLVVWPQNEDISTAIYSQVLACLASPLLPDWAPWICGQLKKSGFMREMAGTMRVVEVRIDEATVDEIVSEGVRRRHISLDGKGARHVGVH